MLEYLHLRNVGPAPFMELEPIAPRLNLITGDNGLGKSFLLDVAWWALTRKWPRELNPKLSSGFPARPTEPKSPAAIAFGLRAQGGKTIQIESSYSRGEGVWTQKPGRPPIAGLVLYALADGSFAVWDPARNYWKQKGNPEANDRLPAFVLSSSELWDGLTVPISGVPTTVCNGLLADWASWIREKGKDADRMAKVLAVLAPDLGGRSLGPGAGFARLSVNDARDIPTVLSYGKEVPILFASLGLRRIVALAYVLTWAWREHLTAAALMGKKPTSRIVMLFDELEAHLHPRWQRLIVPALLRVAQTLTQRKDAAVQLIAATHAPLVLSSVEPSFDITQDAWFDLDFDPVSATVGLEKRQFARYGEVDNWLTSPAFDLPSSRSIEAEKALDEAAIALSDPSFGPDAARKLELKLRSVLGADDPFWLNWRFVGSKKGWLPAEMAQ